MNTQAIYCENFSGINFMNMKYPPLHTNKVRHSSKVISLNYHSNLQGKKICTYLITPYRIATTGTHRKDCTYTQAPIDNRAYWE